MQLNLDRQKNTSIEIKSSVWFSGKICIVYGLSFSNESYAWKV